MNLLPLALRNMREQLVLAQCEAFAVLVTMGELQASGLGRDARPVVPVMSDGAAVREDRSEPAD